MIEQARNRRSHCLKLRGVTVVKSPLHSLTPFTPVYSSWRSGCSPGRVRVAMDKIVSRELWKAVRPLLRYAGWTSFSSRTARRFSQSRIDVVNFQSLNYLASAIGSTTYSFLHPARLFFHRHTALRHQGQRWFADARGSITATCVARFAEVLRAWMCATRCVSTSILRADYLPTVIKATRQGIATEGFAWFQRFSEMTWIWDSL